MNNYAALDLRPVTPGDFPVLPAYYRSFAQGRLWPRYYLSPLQLCKGGIVYTHQAGCLCLLKRAWVMGNPVLYLILPPIHIAPDIRVERWVMDEFRALGISARLDAGDIEQYRYHDVVTPDAGNVEYIYRADMLPTNHHLRNVRNRLRRLEVNHITGAPDANTMTHLGAVMHRWREYKLDMGAKSVYARAGDAMLQCWPALARLRPTESLTSLVMADRCTPAAFTVTEAIVGMWVTLTLDHHDHAYSRLFADGKLATHVNDLDYWREHLSPSALLSAGSALGDKGLERAKEELRPMHKLQLYRLNVQHRLTAEEWKLTAPRAVEQATMFRR